MSNEIRKPLVELVKFLEANKSSTIEDVLEEVHEMCAPKSKASTVHKDEDGNVIAIYCYYHKRWELLEEVEYGSKKSSTTGYNTMCKIGTNRWYKQQRVSKQAKADLIASAIKTALTQDDLNDAVDDIESNRIAIDLSDAPTGYTNIEDFQIN